MNDPNDTTLLMDHTVDLQQYLRILWRRKGLILLCAVTVLCAALVTVQLGPKEYETSVIIRIADRQPLSHELEQLMGSPGRIDRREIDEERKAHFVNRVKSRPFLDQIIRMLDMQNDPGIREKAREDIAREIGEPNAPSASSALVEERAIRLLMDRLVPKIHVTMTGPTIYVLTVTDRDPENAFLLARSISQLFVDVSGEDTSRHLRATHDFGLEQLRNYQDQLTASEEEWEKAKSGVIQNDPTRGLVRHDNVVFAEMLNERIQAEVTSRRSDELLPVPDAARVAALLDDPRLERLSTSLYEALEEEISSRLAAGASPTSAWPPNGTYSIRKRDVLRDVEQIVATSEPTIPQHDRGLYVRVLLAHVYGEAHRMASGFLDSHIAEFKRVTNLTPHDESELARLQSKVETNRRLLQSFQNQLISSEVNQAAQATDLGLQIEILNPAQRPLEAAKPDKVKILLMGLLLGPLIGVGLAFASETMDHTIRTLDDIGRVVPDPVLGTTPLLTRRAIQKPGRLRRHWIPVTVTVVVLMTASIFIAHNTVSNLILTSQPVHMVDPGDNAR